MTYANDWHKVVLAEIKTSYPLNDKTWTIGSLPGGYYYLDIDFFEIVSIKVDDVELTQVSSESDVAATEQTWWQDFWGKTIYIHLTDGADPGEIISGPAYAHDVIAYFWFGFCNGQYTGSDCIDFIPTGCTYNIFYEPWLNEDSIDSLAASVADHFESALEIQFGGLSFINNGWWWQNRHTYYWNNSDARIKIGELGDRYNRYETIFVGKIRNLKIDDELASFELVDSRVGALYSLPIIRYTTSVYANIDTESLDRPIPILFGEKTNITPVCIDTSVWTYKISNTYFNSVNYPLESIDAVYKGGIALSLLTDYTVDLTNGEFTLLADPLDAEITCDAKGICDEFDLTTGAATGNYSENVADHLFFIFNVLNEIPVANINLDSFLELQTIRTQKIALYLDTDTPTMDVNRLFQQSALYHFLPLLDGTFAARYYRKTIPTGTLELRNYDYENFHVFDQAENVYYQVIIKYAQDPTTGIFKTVSSMSNSSKRRYNERRSFEVITALRDQAEAEAICGFYSVLLNAPADKIGTNISLVGRNILPTDKLIVSRSVETDVGEIQILSEEVYAILETNKDFAGAKVAVVAQLDSQLAVFTQHADTPHQDVPHEDHSDTLHGDGSHADEHTDHDDTLHDDSHGDSHSDEVHVDHTDGLYEDQDYIDSHSDDHEDYTDYQHEDVPHIDEEHADHSDTIHVDVHTDVSHIDSEF